MRPGQDQSDLNGTIWQKLDEFSRGQQQLASSVAAIKAQKPSLRQFPSNALRDSTKMLFVFTATRGAIMQEIAHNGDSRTQQQTQVSRASVSAVGAGVIEPQLAAPQLQGTRETTRG